MLLFGGGHLSDGYSAALSAAVLLLFTVGLILLLLLTLLLCGIAKRLKILVLCRRGLCARQADGLIADGTASASVNVIGHKRSGSTATVNVGDLSRCFRSGDAVTLDRLHEIGLVGRECGRYKVLAGGKIDKPLHVTADAFSLASVKMILAAGGTVTKY